MGRANEKHRILAGRFSRAERAKLRQRIVLDDAALTPKTQSRYYSALRKLLPYFEQAANETQIDENICRWIRKMWRSGEPLLTIGDGLSALHFFQPWTRRKLPHAWRLFSVWRNIEVPARAPPLTWELVCCMASYEWCHENFEMAVTLLLAFHCLLRTGEFLALTGYDFSLGSESAVCSLKGTKSGKRRGVDEVISITDIPTLEALRMLLGVRRSANSLSLPIWTGSAAQFRDRFRNLCSIMDVQHHQFRPYSLRRGGATHLFQTTNSMEAALLRGRWESSRVAKCYISDGLSYLPKIRASPKLLLQLKKFTFFQMSRSAQGHSVW